MFPETKDDGFNWFSYDASVDDDTVPEIRESGSQLVKAYDSVLSLIFYLLVALVSVRLFRLFFHEDAYLVYGFNFNAVLNIAIVFCGSLVVFVLALNILVFLLDFVGQKKLEAHLSDLRRLFALFLWFTFGYIKIQHVKREMHHLYKVSKRFLLAGMAATIAYTIGIILMAWFKKFFIRKSLSAKIAETEKSEKILRALKHYRYSIAESPSSENTYYGCPDIFYIDIFGNGLAQNAEGGVSAPDAGLEDGAVKIKAPVLRNMKDAMGLAKDVFVKASSDGHRLSFGEFCQMFSNEGTAVSSYAYFESNNDQVVDRKEFKDVVIHFYKNRALLERSVENTLRFIDMIKRIVFSVIFVILFVFWLIIFGIPFRDLLALALSSALALNFIASGMLNEACRNLIMLFSHQFDIGDDVLIDGESLAVSDVGMTSTSFLCENGGKVKFLNSDLWRKTIINMSKAPEKILVFTFTLPATLRVSEIEGFKRCVRGYLLDRPYDFYETFVLSSSEVSETGVSVLKAAITLKCKGYKNKSKKFLLRAEFTAFLRSLFERLNIEIKV